MTRWHRVAQTTLRALWDGVIPALLSGLALKFLIPSSGHGVRGLIATVGHRFPVPLGGGLFLAFALMARHWKFRVPGGRYASNLPTNVVPFERDGERLERWAALFSTCEAMRSRRMRRRIAALADRSEVDALGLELEGAIESGELERAQAAEAALSARIRPLRVQEQRRESFVTLIAVALAAVFAAGVRSRVAESYQVASSSMVPTLEPDDHVVGRRIAYSAPSALPRRGDVVLFQANAVHHPSANGGPAVIVKRVVGLPGDSIAMRGETPVINGWPVPTCAAGGFLYVSPAGDGGMVHGTVVVEYLDDRAYLTLRSFPAPPFSETYVVQPGEVFVLGDSRANSVDSRAYGDGRGAGVPLTAVVARADWFLLGTHRNGGPDFSRLFQPITRMEQRLRTEGMSSDSLDAGVAKCLANRPAAVRPPPPSEARASESSRRGPT